MNLKKNLIFVLFLALLISISGCTGKKDVKKSLEEIRTGSEGMVISFVANNPPQTIHAEYGSDNEFNVVLQLNNKGAYPQPDDIISPYFGKVYFSGYDKNIMIIKPENSEFNQRSLEGKSSINPNGGIDFLNFKGNVNVNNLNVDKYEPTLLATACYFYSTVAGPQVCIDPDPYSTINVKKVCQVSDLTLSNQGAPIAVTQISEEALAKKTQFRITIKNIGGGDVIKPTSSEKCDPFGTEKLSREDIDRLLLVDVKLGDKTLYCGTFTEGNIRGTTGYIRLINGEGNIICELQSGDYGTINTAYTTPLKIRLDYVYKNTVERKLTIKKETSGLGGGSNSQVGSTDITP